MTTTEYLQTPETVLPRELAYGVLRVADSPVARTIVGPDQPVPSAVFEGFASSPVALFGWPWRH